MYSICKFIAPGTSGVKEGPEPMTLDKDELVGIAYSPDDLYPDPARLTKASDDSIKVKVLQNNKEWAKTFKFPSR